MVSNEYPQPLAALVRLWRWLRYRCLVCGHRIPLTRIWRIKPHYRYCSVECGCYDGTMSMNVRLKTKSSRILTGKTTERYYPKGEKYL